MRNFGDSSSQDSSIPLNTINNVGHSSYESAVAGPSRAESSIEHHAGIPVFLKVVAALWHLKVHKIEDTLLTESVANRCVGLSGEGAQSYVDKVHDSHTFLDGQGKRKNIGIVAYKRSRPSSATTIDDENKRLEAVVREIRVLAHDTLVVHPNIVRLVGYFWETETSISLQRESWFPVLVLEFADNGSLHGLLGSPRIRRLPFECRQRISLDILHGLHALHQCDIIWGDCKPANILMFSTGPSPYDLTAKLTDFGLALVCPQPQDKLLGGTPSWRDPIKAAGFEQLCASDVYSTGLVIGAIMCDGRQFDTYMNQDSAAKSNSSGRNERIECAKFNGKIVEHLLTAIEKVLRPSFQDQELPPALSSTLELEKVKSAIRMAMADREPLERIIQVLENGRRFLDQTMVTYQPTTEIPTMSSIRIERNHDSLSAGPARAVVRCLEDTLSGCMEDPYSSNAFSCIFFQLGVCYAVGFGVNQNMLEAKRYFNNAAESGSIDAQAIIERFEEQTDRRLIDLNKPSRWSHNGAMAGSWIAAKCVAEFPKTLLAIYEHLAKEDSHMTSEAWTSLPGLETLLDELKDSNSGINDKTFTSRKDKVMHIATLKNDLPALKLLTQNPDIDINATNSKGETPLICAMRAGNRRCATFLIDQGASVTAEDERGITAVHWIINCLDTSDDVARLIEKFQQRGANLHARSRCALIYSDLYGAILFPGTPLDWAVDTGNFVALRILAERYILVAENGADPFDLTFRNGRPPAIHRMASNHQHELLTAFKRCIEFKALLQQLDTEGKSALWYALQPGNSFNRLMYDTPNTQGQSQTLKHLIEGGADVRYVNSSGETALYSAVKAGSLPCVEFLLARQEVQQMLCSRSSPQEFSPLRRSIYAENTGIFYSIFQHLDISDIGEWGYEVSPDGLNLLHECCLGPEQVSVSIAESLLTEQCESNREELLGQRCCGCDLTPFQLAVLCNKLELAEIFIHHGANPLEGHHDQRFLGYLLEYQTFTEEHVTTLLQTIIDDEAVRSVRRLPHPGQILPAVQYLVRSDKKWFDTSNKNLEHAPKFISSTSIDKLGSFLVSAREDPKQSVEYGSRWVTALDLALDCVSRSAFRKPAESVFATVLSHWNKSKYVNFPDVQVLHNTSMRIRNLRRRETLLHRAIRLGSPEIVESLLNSEADWEMANHEWMSPLHLAKNIAFPHHLQGLFVERYATSFWGRLAQPQHQVSIAREMKAELIVDILQQRKTPWTDILLIRALREVWWPWDDYEIDNFGYKHLILWLFVVSVVVGILAILFIASAERPSVAPIVDLYHNITQAWEDVGTEFFSTITSCFDDCYRKGCDPATVCGLAWLNRIHAGNARLISISDWVVGRELDCYDLAKARNQSYDDCRGTLSPTYFWGEFQKGALPFSIYNMTNELCTVEFELRAPNKTGDGS